MSKIITLLVLIFSTWALAQTEAPAWQSLELTNAQTGEAFSFADFAGKTVFVEPMATWCTNCRKQLNNVKAAKAELDEEAFVFIALSVAENISDQELASYAEREGFDFTFAVASQELLQGLVDEFGRAVTSPPSTPHFIVYPDGSVSELITGREAPEVILAQLTE